MALTDADVSVVASTTEKCGTLGLSPNEGCLQSVARFGTIPSHFSAVGAAATYSEGTHVNRPIFNFHFDLDLNRVSDTITRL